MDVCSDGDGGKTPAKLYGLSLARSTTDSDIGKHTKQYNIERMSLEAALLDTGSAITLAGERAAQQWISAGFARSVQPRERSIRGIRGIGALNRVSYWIRISLDVGGFLVTFHDVPVIKEHDGLLIGNDFLGKGGADVRYAGADTGTLTLRQGNASSSPLRFHTAAVTDYPLSELARSNIAEVGSDTAMPPAANFGDVTAEEREQQRKQQMIAPEVEEAIKSITPIGWVPETIEIPAWSEAHFRIRLPASLTKARDVLLLPLEDERKEDIGIMVAPTLQRVTEDGYVTCRAINMHKEKKRIPLLTPIVRFQVDPRVFNVEYEYTTEEMLLCFFHYKFLFIVAYSSRLH